MRNRVYFLFLVFALFSVQTVWGKTHKTDSLENVLKSHTKNSTKKVDLMNDIALDVYSTNIEKALNYTTQSAQLSDSLMYTKGKAASLWITGLAHSLSDNHAAIEYYQQAIEIINKINEPKLKCNTLIALGFAYSELGESEKSHEFFEEAHQIAMNLKNKNLILKSLTNITKYHSSKGEYSKSIAILENAIHLAEEMKDNVMLATTLNSLASIFFTQSNYSAALENYYRSLKINEKLGRKSAIATNYVNIAGIHSEQRDFDEALKYLFSALEIAQNIEDKRLLPACLANIGHIYMQKKDRRALEYYEKALKIVGNNNVSLTVNILVNMGIIHTHQKKYTKAIDYLNEAYKLADKSKLMRPIGEIWAKIGLVYMHQKRFTEALEYSNKSLEIANELKLLNLQKEVYGQLSMIYAATNNYQAAYQNHIEYKIYNDSIFSESNVKKIADMENAYKYDKEKEVYEIKVQNNNLKIKIQRWVIFLLFVAFILIVLLGVMSYRSHQLKKQLLYMQLLEANDELEKNHKKMTSATLKLVQTAERDIHSIKILENIEKNTNSEVREEIKSLIFDYKSQAFNSNWEEFEILFQKVHPSFYDNLNIQFPSLTQNERKLCAFMKLNMSNKQIAQITFQSEDALKKARQRLRKKLGIERDTNLVSFIQSI